MDHQSHRNLPTPTTKGVPSKQGQGTPGGTRKKRGTAGTKIKQPQILTHNQPKP